MKIYALITLICVATQIGAQTFDADSSLVSISTDQEFIELTAQQKKDFEEAAVQSVKLYGDYLQVIAGKNKSKTQRDNAIFGALELFLDEQRIVEISSKNNDVIKRKYIPEYLNGLRGMSYTSVEITFYNVYIATTLQKDPDNPNRWIGVATFYQSFKGCKSDNGCYRDITKKNITFYVVEETIYKGSQKETKFGIKLGDIYVLETRDQ